MGLCFEKADEEKLARGWPNLIVPVDGLPQDKRPATAVEKAWRVSDPIYFTEWPRLTLHRFLHGATETVFIQYTEEHWAAIRAGFQKAEPPTAKALLDALRRLFREGYDTYQFQERAFVYGTETLAGTDATLATIVDEMVHFDVPKENPGLNHICRASLAETTYFLMLRASPAAVKAARAGLATAAAFSGPRKGYDEYFEALDYVANGAAGVKRCMGTWMSMEVSALSTGASLEYAADDPTYVGESVKKADRKDSMSVRVAWIAGPSALEGLEGRKWPAAQLPSIVRDFGMLRDPNVVKLMLSLVGKSSVKDGPLNWFRAHAAYVKPLLAKQTGTAAKAVLRQL
jgi:hypothetical protein